MYKVTRHMTRVGDVPCERKITYTVLNTVTNEYVTVVENGKDTNHLTKKQLYALILKTFTPTNFVSIP